MTAATRSTMDGDALTVEKTLNAPADAIFRLLSDAAKHRLFDGSGSVRGLRDTQDKDWEEPLELGSEFAMSMKQGHLPYTTSNTVVEFERDRRIAWRTSGLGGLIGGRVWRYELEPTSDGRTIVRETWDLSADKQRFFLRRGGLPGTTRRNIERTLGRLQHAARESAQRAA